MTQDDILKLFLSIISSSVVAGLVTAIVNYYLNENRDKKKEEKKQYSERIIIVETFLFDLSTLLDRMYRLWNSEFSGEDFLNSPKFIETISKIHELLDRFTQVFVLNTPFLDFTDNPKILRRNIDEFLYCVEHQAKEFETDESDAVFNKYISNVIASYEMSIKQVKAINIILYSIRIGDNVHPIQIRTLK